MSTTILECAERDGVGTTNGEWENTFNGKAITLSEGDLLQVKTALVNTDNPSSSLAIFEEDEEVSISFNFYDQTLGGYKRVVNLNINNTENNNQGNNLDELNSMSLFRMPVAIAGDTRAPYLRNFQMPEIDDSPFQLRVNNVTGTKHDFLNKEFVLFDVSSSSGVKLASKDVTVPFRAGVYDASEIAQKITNKLQTERATLLAPSDKFFVPTLTTTGTGSTAMATAGMFLSDTTLTVSYYHSAFYGTALKDNDKVRLAVAGSSDLANYLNSNDVTVTNHRATNTPKTENYGRRMRLFLDENGKVFLFLSGGTGVFNNIQNYKTIWLRSCDILNVQQEDQTADNVPAEDRIWLAQYICDRPLEMTGFSNNTPIPDNDLIQIFLSISTADSPSGSTIPTAPFGVNNNLPNSVDNFVEFSDYYFLNQFDVDVSGHSGSVPEYGGTITHINSSPYQTSGFVACPLDDVDSTIASSTFNMNYAQNIDYTDVGVPLYGYVPIQPKNENTPIHLQLGSTGAAMTLEETNLRFEYLHMPVFTDGTQADPDSDGTALFVNQVASSYTSGVYARFSGCLYSDVQPDAVRQTLGFGTGFSGKSDFASNTTTAYVTNDSKIDKKFPLPSSQPAQVATEQPEWLTYLDVDKSTNVFSRTPFQSDDIGYYLISTTTSFQNQFRNEESTFTSVSSIASKNYNNADFITVYDESSIPYEHRGEPVVISNIKCSILDPRTKEVASQLGDQSVIFIQIQNNISENTIGNGLQDGFKQSRGKDETAKKSKS